ncbi:hypothetical protein [Klebsiella pneumoniae]|uniref:hypothetical protein n=1 Tax=Klebsiella pneumoniae TaxID=573 RepID=UPI003F7F53F7
MNYHRGVWHHPVLTIEKRGDFHHHVAEHITHSPTPQRDGAAIGDGQPYKEHDPPA